LALLVEIFAGLVIGIASSDRNLAADRLASAARISSFVHPAQHL